jgi:hypothetical protein
LEKIVDLFELSESQSVFLKSGEKGTGLIICGKKIIPFSNKIPTDSLLYGIFSTDFKEYQKTLSERKT